MSAGRERRFDLFTLLAASVLVLLPLLVYLPVLRAGFIWDDNWYVTENATLRTLSGLRYIWFVPGSLPQYYPMVHTLFWVEQHLWGYSPAGYHAVNVALHALSVLLVWRLLLRLRVPGAWWAAAIFAVHPVMTESVAWVTERKNVLSLAFALGSLLAYLRFSDPIDPADPDASDVPGSKRWLSYLLALLLFVAALLSKTVVCSLPAVLLLVYWWKRGRVSVRDVLPLLPFFATGIALGLHTVWVERHHVGAHGAEFAFTALERCIIAGRALWFYVGKLVWPHPLVFFYPRWTIDARAASQLAFPLAVLLLVGALWLARHRIGRGPLVAVLLFAGVLFPALGFFDVYPFRYSFVADHFQYHASIALIALFTAGVAHWASGRGPAARRAVFGLGIATLLGLGALTVRQVRNYHDLETLFRATIAANPGAWAAYSNLAQHLASVGRVDEAIQIARDGVAAAPEIPEVHNTLGAMWMQSASRGGQNADALERAIASFQETLRLEPGYEETIFNLATTLAAAGRPDEAIRYFSRALEIHPEDVGAMVGLGNVLMGQRSFGAARDVYAEAVRIEARNPVLRNNLGVALLELGEAGEAARQFGEAIALAPGYAEARTNLAVARARLGASAAP